MSTTPRSDADFTALFRDVFDDAVRFATRRVGNDAAEEAVQTAMSTVWRRFEDAPRGLDARRAWVFGIVRNTLLNQRRGDTRRTALGVRIAEAPAVGTPDEFADADVRLDFATAWRALDAAQQEVLALCLFDDLDAPSAASVLGIRPATYRMRLSRARRTLQRAFALAQSTDPEAAHRMAATGVGATSAATNHGTRHAGRNKETA